MTKETSQSCAEKIAELEPKLRELVERGAPDEEVLAVQNAIQAAKIRLPILAEKEEKERYEEGVRKQREITPVAEAAIKAASLEVAFGDLFDAVDTAIASIGKELQRLPEFRADLEQSVQTASALAKQAFLHYQPPRGDAQGLAKALRDRIAAAMQALDLPRGIGSTMPPIYFIERTTPTKFHPLHVPDSLVYRGVTVDVNGVATPGPVRPAAEITADEVVRIDQEAAE